MVTKPKTVEVSERPWHDGWFEENQDECALPRSRYPMQKSASYRHGTGQSEADRADDDIREYDFGGNGEAIDQ